MKCRDRLHEIVKQEVEGFKEEESVEWKETMESSFVKMDKEVGNWCVEGENSSTCRCGLQTPQGDAVGSTAVVAVVTPEKIIVSNCGDSRAVLCRNGVAIPLSSDHKVRLIISFKLIHAFSFCLEWLFMNHVKEQVEMLFPLKELGVRMWVKVWALALLIVDS